MRCIQFTNGFVAIAFLAFLIYVYVSTTGHWWGLAMISQGLGEGLFLVIAVLYMRSAINTNGQKLVNECFILIHISNFFLWGVFFTMQNIWATKIWKECGDLSPDQRD